MKFEQFLNEQNLEEYNQTLSFKVETTLRSKNLEYKKERTDTYIDFILSDGRIVRSKNDGTVELVNGGKVEKSKHTLDISLIPTIVNELLK